MFMCGTKIEFIGPLVTEKRLIKKLLNISTGRHASQEILDQRSNMMKILEIKGNNDRESLD
jgi:hypothetical protein